MARAKAVKKVWVRTPQIGNRKIAKINFTHFVGTVSGSDVAMKFRGVARATLRTTFRPRFELRVLRLFFDLRFVAKSSADYADLRRRRQDRTADLQGKVARATGLRITPHYLSRAPHVGAGAGVDFDRFAFLDKKRDVNGFPGFELCRFGDVAGGIAAKSLR